MDVVQFAEEFGQLLCHWMKPLLNQKDGTWAPRLTNQQIVNTIQNVLQVHLGVDLPMPDNSSVTTPATGIAVCTPSAPMVPKCSLDSANTSLGRYRSLDTLMTDDKDATLKFEDLTSKSQEDMDVDECIANEAAIEEKKLMSRSSPAIHMTRSVKSNTFIREQEKAKAIAEQATNNIFIKSEASVDELQRIVKKIDELRDCAANVVSRIDDVKKEVCPQSLKPIRRLSSIGGFSGPGRSTTLMRPMPPSKPRRSASSVLGTPTSSKLNTATKVEKIEKVEKISLRRSMAATSTVRSPKSVPRTRNRSPSTATFIIKKSPCTTKNPKFAHVQSTIPKPTTTKRKAP